MKNMRNFVEKERKNLLFLVITFFLAPILAMIPILPPQLNAFSGVFGGRMSVVAYCTCSSGHVISVGPPRPGRFHYVPGKTKVFEYRQIAANGVWVLGTYGSPSPCMRRISPTICVPVVHQGDIELVGTSNFKLKSE